MIHNINNRRNKSIGFKNERLDKLEKEIKDKEKEIRNNKRSKIKQERDKIIFNCRATDGTPFYFSDDLYKKNLTFDEAEEEQKEMLKRSMN